MGLIYFFKIVYYCLIFCFFLLIVKDENIIIIFYICYEINEEENILYCEIVGYYMWVGVWIKGFYVLIII